METELHPHADWQTATVTQITVENPTVKTFRLSLPHKLPHLAGQHCDIRLTAPDGYQAARSYSVASAPALEGAIDITVQMIPGGEVSGYLDSQVRVGDQLEVKTPIGYHFTWIGESDQPVTLIGGGSGVVPLMSILRHHQSINSAAPLQLIYSVRDLDSLIYGPELEALFKRATNPKVILTLSDHWPEGWSGNTGRIDQAKLSEWCPSDQPQQFFVCGPTPMVEAVASALVTIGHDATSIKTERFGPTGGKS